MVCELGDIADVFRSQPRDRYGILAEPPRFGLRKVKYHDEHELPNESGIRGLRRPHAIRLGAAASGLAIVLGCLERPAPALAAPSEPAGSCEGSSPSRGGEPRAYRVSGELIGTYRLRRERVINDWT